jgi:hypothetical protein
MQSRVIFAFSIFAQVNITNPTRWLVKFDVLICYIHSPTGEYNKMEIFKTAARVSDKEISEIKMNSDQK